MKRKSLLFGCVTVTAVAGSSPDLSIHNCFAGPGGPDGRDHTPRCPRRIGIYYRAGEFEEEDGVTHL